MGMTMKSTSGAADSRRPHIWTIFNYGRVSDGEQSSGPQTNIPPCYYSGQNTVSYTVSGWNNILYTS